MKVYIIQVGNKKGPIKIGVAMDPDKRLKVLQIGNHLELKLIAVIPCNGRKRAFELERILHYELKGLKIRGEWFSGKAKLGNLFLRVQEKGFSAECNGGVVSKY